MNHGARFKLLAKIRSVVQDFFQEFLPETARFVDFHELQFVYRNMGAGRH